MKTKEKIVQASLELFNEFGVNAITTNHIAAHLGISPGNLYYHFRNKEDIITSIFDNYIAQMEASFHLNDTPIDMEQLAFFAEQVVANLWQYRFFYASMTDILQRDEELRQRYLKMQENVMGRAKAIVLALRESCLIEIDDEDVMDLVEILRLIDSFGVSFLMCKAHSNQVSEAEASDVVVKLIAAIKGYATPQAKEGFSALQQKYRSKNVIQTA